MVKLLCRKDTMFQLHYEPLNINDFMNVVHCDFVGRKNKLANVPCSFDIETTSFYDHDEKRAIMYVWQFGFNGFVTMGRTWGEFIILLKRIQKKLGLNEHKKLICYVHNLSFEFQFIRKLFTWVKVFSNEERKPIYALSTLGVEFRDSLILSGYSLAKLGDELQKYKVHKLVGDLDYSKLRNRKTKLSNKEIQYCINDVLVVMAYIRELIERYGNIANLPLTKTGFVRKAARRKCLHNGRHIDRRYSAMIHELTLDPEEFETLHRAFQGGFTHANALYTGYLLNDVASYDFTSSYPAVMVSEKFPMSKGKKNYIHSESEFYNLINNYCCVFDIEMYDVKPKLLCDSPISASKCAGLKNPKYNNGRLWSADHLYTTITNVDYAIYKEFYTWSYAVVKYVWTYEPDYLPKKFVSFIFDLYKKKTELKDVAGSEVEYMQSKAMLNSCYGMCVTNPLRDSIVYDHEWRTDPVQSDALNKYNEDPKRFLFYPWGVFVTAYARRNLFTAIKEFNTDYVYSDTDSVKVRNYNAHYAYIESYNANITKKINNVCTHYGLSTELAKPKTKDGKVKPLGVWDFEGVYTHFKTLGAKRYMTYKDNQISFTIAGLNKNVAMPYLIEKYNTGENVFEHFENGLTIPPAKTGKLLHTYIDDVQIGTMTDYQGNTVTYLELSGLHLEPTGFTLAISNEYLNFLLGVKTQYDVLQP